MASTASYTVTTLIGGKTITKTFTRSSDHTNNYIDEPLPAGKLSTDWVKTDADTAACNLSAGHGYVTGKMSCFWSDATTGRPKQRHYVDATVTVNAVALDGGTGDDFPETGVADVVLCEEVTITVVSDGDTMVGMSVCLEFAVTTETLYGGCDFRDVGVATVKYMHLPPNEQITWTLDAVHANPLTGNPVTHAFAANGSATNAATLSICILEDALP